MNVVKIIFERKARVMLGSLESAKQRLNVHMAWNVKSEGLTLYIDRR